MGFEPAEGLSGSAVELKSDGVEVVLGVFGQVGALWEVLAQEPVGVLVGAALPRGVRVAEEHRNAGGDGEPGVFGHLPALVPGQGALQQGGKAAHRDLQQRGQPDRGVVVRHPRQDRVPRGPLDQGDDRRGVARAHDQVPLPVAGNSPVLGLWWTLGEHDHVLDDLPVAGDSTPLTERPPEAEDRAVPGHWEGDLIMGAGNASAIITLVERASRYTILARVPHDHTAIRLAALLQIAMGRLPSLLKRSLAWDQGREMTEHARFTVATGIPVFFCDPHSPWQRGTNENTNGLLRQYFPKGTDLSEYSQDHLDAVALQLNGRPRQTLGWLKPHERLDQLLNAADDALTG